jgi:hypothetical protein
MLSLRRRSQRVEQTDTASSNVIDPQLEKMLHPRPPMAKQNSVTTSFSSVYVDHPAVASASSSDYGDEWGLTTPDSSVLYPKSDYEKDFFAPISRPQRTYAPASTTGSFKSKEGIAMGKRPMHYGYGKGYDHAPRTKHVPHTQYTPRPADPRKSALMRQSVRPESTKSSVRARSHLNEVQIAEYGTVDGRL